MSPKRKELKVRNVVKMPKKTENLIKNQKTIRLNIELSNYLTIQIKFFANNSLQVKKMGVYSFQTKINHKKKLRKEIPHV